MNLICSSRVRYWPAVDRKVNPAATPTGMIPAKAAQGSITASSANG
jgi:hypothetical protein